MQKLYFRYLFGFSLLDHASLSTRCPEISCRFIKIKDRFIGPNLFWTIVCFSWNLPCTFNRLIKFWWCDDDDDDDDDDNDDDDNTDADDNNDDDDDVMIMMMVWWW